MMTVGEAAGMLGVSVRTLRYYDEIGIVTPSGFTDAGYRLYAEADIARARRVLVLREIELPLCEIASMLDGGGPDAGTLARQREVLIRRRERLTFLIGKIDEMTEGTPMAKKNAQYAEEAKTRWGDTPEYAESESRHAGYSGETEDEITRQADEIFAGFAALMDRDVNDPDVVRQVEAWQAHITRWHYPCSKEILAGLGLMYTADERFRANLDRFGDGNASFISEAIAAYCEKKD